jgi:hypothetical protein
MCVSGAWPDTVIYQGPANFQGRTCLLTPLWKGERYADGRPKVPDGIIKRMKLVSIEEAWATLKNEGYGYQIAEDWPVKINPDSVLVGRVVTATFMPARKDVWLANRRQYAGCLLCKRYPRSDGSMGYL